MAHRERSKPAHRAREGRRPVGTGPGPVHEGRAGDMRTKLAIVGSVLAAVFAWAYWPTLVGLARAWERQPDYSHGYLVLPLALYFLWARRERFPGVAAGFAWPGLALIVLGIGVRMLAAHFYIEAVDGWSIMVWAAGVAWLLGGWRVMLWGMPSIAFLWFMVPLPWHAERVLSLPLQKIATKLSCFALVSLGQPALARENTILIGDYQLGVEQACSGLRIFVGIVALAFAYLVLVRRAWWEKALLLVSVVPIALIANSTRIVVTALLYRYVSGDAAQEFVHEWAGFVMIPYAAGLFALVLWYLGKVTYEVEAVEVKDILRPKEV